jgi:hypothetical protein
MSLPTREQQVLDGIETVLQAGEARLTSMFMLFTRLTSDEEKPGAEQLRPQPQPPQPQPRPQRGWQRPARAMGRPPGHAWPAGRPPAGRWTASRPAGQLRMVILLALAAVALGSAVLFGLGAASSCGPAVVVHSHGSVFSQPRACQPSQSVPTPKSTP